MFWLLIECVIESNFKRKNTENFALLFGPQWNVNMTVYTFLSLCMNSYKEEKRSQYLLRIVAIEPVYSILS